MEPRLRALTETFPSRDGDGADTNPGIKEYAGPTLAHGEAPVPTAAVARISDQARALGE